MEGFEQIHCLERLTDVNPTHFLCTHFTFDDAVPLDVQTKVCDSLVLRLNRVKCAHVFPARGRFQETEGRVAPDFLVHCQPFFSTIEISICWHVVVLPNKTMSKMFFLVSRLADTYVRQLTLKQLASVERAIRTEFGLTTNHLQLDHLLTKKGERNSIGNVRGSCEG